MVFARREMGRTLLFGAFTLAMATAGAILRKSPADADIPSWPTVAALIHWDAGWYGSIAKDGYWYHPGQQSPVAFFPLFPMAIRAVSGLGPNRWLAAVGLAFSFGFGALLVVSAWARRVLPAHAWTAGTLLATYPFALYLYGVVYSDGLFLLCVASAFWAVEVDRPWLAAALGILATTARPLGLTVTVGLLALSLERRRAAGGAFRVRDFIPALSALGLFAWMAYLQWRFDDALAFIHVQNAPGWHDQPFLTRALKVAFFQRMSGAAPLVALRLGGHALATVAALALVVPTFRRLGWGYGLYVALAVGIPAIASEDFHSVGRYILGAFPLFLTAASMLDDVPRVRSVVLVGFAGLLGFCAMCFGAGGYVA